MTTTLFWGEIGPEASRHRMRVDGESAQRWQGIHEPSWQVWLFRSEASPAIDEFTQLAGEDFQRRVLSAARQWGSTEAVVANFVLRELRPEAIDDIVPGLHRQIEAVAARPGCVGCTLAAEVGQPHNLLGVTYWQHQAAFDQYAAWASQHAWRDVITPVTLAVPLRLLAQRMD